MKSPRLTPFFFLRPPNGGLDWARATAAFAGAAGLGLAVPMATLVLFGWVVPQTDFPILGWLVTGLLAVALASSALEWVGGRNCLRVGGRAERHWVPLVWSRLLQMPLRWLREAGPVESGSRAQAVHEIILRSMEWTPRLHTAIAVALANVLFLFFIDRFLAIVGILGAGAAWLVLIALNQRRTRAIETEFQFAETLHSEALGWIRDSDSHRLAGTWGRMEKRAAQLRSERLAARRQAGWGDGWRAALFAGATALPCLILFAAVDQTDLAIGSFLAFLIAFGSLVGSLRVIADAWPVIAELRALANRAQPLGEETIVAREEPKFTGELPGGIEMEGIHFRYSPGSPEVLADFSMSIAAGERVALTGPSGGGKSTVVKLLAGREIPEAGRIRFDLCELDSETLRQHLGVVSHRGAWYSGDLRQNLVGESKVSLDEASHAAELAGLAEEIRALPMQMHTLVAEGAANFSAGQRQRILLARALVKRPRILILDGAMNSLDLPAQHRLMDSLAKIAATQVIVTQRLSILARVDRVFFLDQGRIVESGSYEELRARRGKFSEWIESSKRFGNGGVV